MTTRYEAANDMLKVRAYASGYVVWLAWDYTGDRTDLIGFALSRAGGASSAPEWLRGMRRFKSAKDKSESADNSKDEAEANANQPLNVAPVQAFSWADYAATPGQNYRYHLEALHGSPSDLKPRASIDLDVHTLALGIARHNVFFNRGAAGSQAYARKFGNKPPSEVPDRAAYKWLSRGLEEALMSFIGQAIDKRWALRVAAYELDYVPFLVALRQAHERGVDVKVVHDCKKGKDHVPRADAAIEKAQLPTHILIRRTAETSAISHNKFIVAIRDGVPCDLWTGSCNFTEGGLYGQANAGHWLRNDQSVASQYLDYWSRLAADPSVKELRVANDAATPLPTVLNPRSTTVLFSPRGSGDALRFYTDLFRRAQHSLCFTAAFGINKEFADVLVEGNASNVLRYVCLEKRGKGQADIERLPFNRVSVGAVLEADSDAPWQEEKLSGLNQHVEYIHTKVLLIDPFSADPTVVVGSGNFSSASVEKNDENMLVVRGDTQLSDQYLVEFMRIFNHFHFRNQVSTAKKAGDASAPLWLSPDSSWTAPFYAADSPAAKERLLFVGSLDSANAHTHHKELVINLAPTLPASPAAAKEAREKETGKVELAADGGFAVTFAYNKDAVEALKTTLTTQQRRWDGDAKRWLVSAYAAPALSQLISTYRWTVTPPAAALLASPPPPPPQAATTIPSPSSSAAPSVSMPVSIAPIASPPYPLPTPFSSSTSAAPPVASFFDCVLTAPADDLAAAAITTALSLKGVSSVQRIDDSAASPLLVLHSSHAQGVAPAFALIDELLTSAPPLVPSDATQRAQVLRLAEEFYVHTFPLLSSSVLSYTKASSPNWAQHWIVAACKRLEPLIALTAGRYAVSNSASLVDCCLRPLLLFARRLSCDLAAFPVLIRIGRSLDDALPAKP